MKAWTLTARDRATGRELARYTTEPGDWHSAVLVLDAADIIGGPDGAAVINHGIAFEARIGDPPLPVIDSTAVELPL